MVPICVSDPTGSECPCRTSSTPLISVVLTAPIPGVSTPSFPFGEAILTGLRIHLPPVLVSDFMRHQASRAELIDLPSCLFSTQTEPCVRPQCDTPCGAR